MKVDQAVEKEGNRKMGILGIESGLEVIAGQTEDFTGMLELLETDSQGDFQIAII